MTRKLLAPLLALLALAVPALAQTTIQAEKIFGQTTRLPFSAEWQYLSTDLFLFQEDKFQELVLYIADTVRQERGRLGRWPELSYLMVTATMENNGYFKSDLTYPLFSFNIDRQGTSYTTTTGNSNEVLRLIDKMPLGDDDRAISTQIKCEALLEENMGQVGEMVSSQLLSISTIANPSAAVMGLVGEFGKLMQAQSAGQKFEFSSTIRLYEAQNFDQRVHSVSVYVFKPHNKPAPQPDFVQLAQFVDTATFSTLDRLRLKSLVGDFCPYPYMVVVNYKSKYRPQPLVPDLVTPESIERRAQQVEDAYQNQLINQATYMHEKKLVEFMNAFHLLKYQIQGYERDRDDNLADMSRSYYNILREYRNLRNLFDARRREFRQDDLFHNVFKAKYDDLVRTAELYLDKDQNLENIKNLVEVMFHFEAETQMELDSAQREDYLETLHAVALPENLANSLEMLAINQLVEKMEQEQQLEVYRKYVTRIQFADPSPENQRMTQQIRELMRTSNCVSCAEKIDLAIADFDARYQEARRLETLEGSEAAFSNARRAILRTMQKEQCIKANLSRIVDPRMATFIESDMVDIINLRENLQIALQVNLENRAQAEIDVYSKKIVEQTNQINKRLEDFCVQTDIGFDICGCQGDEPDGQCARCPAKNGGGPQGAGPPLGFGPMASV